MTRNLRWIKLDSGIDLLDAPGVIPPNLENQKSALNLALCDDIGEAAYEIESVAVGFIKIISTLINDKNANISEKKISSRSIPLSNFIHLKLRVTPAFLALSTTLFFAILLINADLPTFGKPSVRALIGLIRIPLESLLSSIEDLDFLAA